MSKNYMAEVAKSLGLELEEVFRIDGEDGYFMLVETGLWRKINSEDEYWRMAHYDILHNLMIAVYEIIKLHWKPRKGEMFYVPALETDSLSRCIRWLGTETDKNLYDRGLVFKTREEAAKVSTANVSSSKEEEHND